MNSAMQTGFSGPLLASTRKHHRSSLDMGNRVGSHFGRKWGRKKNTRRHFHFLERYRDGRWHSFSYDLVSNRTLMADPTGRSTWTYDAVDRVRTATSPPAKRITYSYDAVGRRAGMIDPDAGRFTYVYDAAGRSRYLVNPLNERSTFSYDAAGRLEVQRLGNATRASPVGQAVPDTSCH